MKALAWRNAATLILSIPTTSYAAACATGAVFAKKVCFVAFMLFKLQLPTLLWIVETNVVFPQTSKL